MEELTESKIEEIKDLFASIDDKNIEKKLRLVKIFWKAETHVSSEELLDTPELSRENIEKEFVDSTLFLLWKLGMAHRVEFENRPVKYEPIYLGDHHDHMICIECGKIIEFEDPRLERIQDSVADKYGFNLIRHKLEFYGICGKCSSKRGEEIPLKDAKTGEIMEVAALKGGAVLNKRCASMGIIKSAMIEVLNANNGGQVIVGCSGSRYVLGKGITEKIIVKRVYEEKCMMGKKPACPYVNNSDHAFISGCRRGSEETLSSFKNGDKGVIIRTGGCKRLRRRLFEMGLLNGAEFEVVKYAPLKDPMEIIVRGSHISLRVEEAKHIIVRKNEGLS